MNRPMTLPPLVTDLPKSRREAARSARAEDAHRDELPEDMPRPDKGTQRRMTSGRIDAGQPIPGCWRWVLLIALQGLVLASCSEWVTCRVVSKRFAPAHEVVHEDSICVSRTKAGMCVISIPTHWTEHVPDRWFATYRKPDGETHEQEVSRDIFNGQAETATHEHIR